MKTSRIKAALCAFAAAFVFAACSNMMQELKATASGEAKRFLNIKSVSMTNPPDPANIVTVTVDDAVPQTPSPTLVYTLTDGTKVEVVGAVTENPDGTKTLTFDLNPLDKTKLLGGPLPLAITASRYDPTPATAQYLPPFAVGIALGDKDGTDTNDDGLYDQYDVYKYEADHDEVAAPTVKTNYQDSLVEKSPVITYKDQAGNELADWDAVMDWLKDTANYDKYVEVENEATLKPSTTPTKGTTRIYCRKDKPITKVEVEPDKVNAGVAVEAKAYINTTLYTAVTWQWFMADSKTASGSAISGATNNKYTPTEALVGKWIWAKATQVDPVTEKESDRLEVKAKAALDYEVLGNYSLAMSAADQGNNVFAFTAVTNIPNPTLTWLVDGTHKQSGANLLFTLDLASYPLGWHNVEVRTAKDATPYSARKSVKRKAVQTPPVVAPSQVTKVSELNAHDGKISGLDDTMEWSDDDGLTYKPVQGGEISGLAEGDIKIRYIADDDKAASAPTTVNVPTQTYTVTAPGSVTGGSVVASKTTVKAGETVTLTIAPGTGYELNEIAATAGTSPVPLSGSGSERTFTMPKSDVTVTGSFKKIKYSVILNNGDNGQVTSSATVPVEWGTEITLTIVPNPDYVLDTISAAYSGGDVALSGDDSQKTFTMPIGDVTITSAFKKQSYALTLSSEEHGSLSAVPSGNVQWGTEVALTIAPDTGYELDAISAKDADGGDVALSGSGNERTFTMLKNDVTVTASFKKQTYSVTVNDSEHGEVISSATGPVEWGTEVTLTIAPSAGYVLDAIGATSGENPVTLTGDGDTRTFTMPKGDVTVTATFKENQAAPQPEPGQQGADDYTYDTSNFLNTKFYYVKDVQWDPANPNGTVRPSGNAYSGDGETPDDWWTAGSYTTLTKNSQTTTAGQDFGNTDNQKVIPTYTLTLYTKKDGGYEQHELGTRVIILGLDKNNGFMAQNDGWGTFFYTQKGWADSDEGSSELGVNYTGCIYPTYDEIMSFINGN